MCVTVYRQNARTPIKNIRIVCEDCVLSRKTRPHAIPAASSFAPDTSGSSTPLPLLLHIHMYMYIQKMGVMGWVGCRSLQKDKKYHFNLYTFLCCNAAPGWNTRCCIEMCQSYYWHHMTCITCCYVHVSDRAGECCKEITSLNSNDIYPLQCNTPIPCPYPRRTRDQATMGDCIETVTKFKWYF